MKVFFQTAESIPPPYANKIEIECILQPSKVELLFKQTYLQRDELEQEDILEEGFSLNDDTSWQGELNEAWKEAIVSLSKSTKEYLPATNSAYDEVFIESEGEKLSPKNTDSAKRFIEQLQQAVFEHMKKEAPLSIIIKEISNSSERTTQLSASFSERSYTQTVNGQEVLQQWNQLDEHLKLIFAGDYIFEKASNKSPSKRGVYVNFAKDEWWFEVGKSVLIQPAKIQGFLV